MVWPLIPSVTVPRGHGRCVSCVWGTQRAAPRGVLRLSGCEAVLSSASRSCGDPADPRVMAGCAYQHACGCRDHTPQRRQVSHLQTVSENKHGGLQTTAYGDGRHRLCSSIRGVQGVSLVLTRPGYLVLLLSCCSLD